MNYGDLTVKQIMEAINKSQDASVRRSSDLRPKIALRLTLPLDVARLSTNPMVIFQPFNGFYVEDTTDSTTEVKFSFGSNDQYSIDNYTTLRQNDAAYSPDEQKQCSLYWDAQPGKTMVLVFYVGIEYRPGSLISAIEGGVTVSDGAALSSSQLGAAGTASLVACPAAAATQILQANADRKTAVLYFDAPGFLGDSTASAVGPVGALVGPGLVIIQSPAAHYVYPQGGPVNVSGNCYE